VKDHGLARELEGAKARVPMPSRPPRNHDDIMKFAQGTGSAYQLRRAWKRAFEEERAMFMAEIKG